MYLNLSIINTYIVPVMKTSTTWTISTTMLLSAAIKVKTFGWIVVGQSTLCFGFCFCVCFGFATCCRWKRFSLTDGRTDEQQTIQQAMRKIIYTAANNWTQHNPTQLNWTELKNAFHIYCRLVYVLLFTFCICLTSLYLLHIAVMRGNLW